MPTPGDLNSYNFKENPFAQFAEGLGGGAAAPQPAPQVQQKNAAIGAAQGVENAMVANPQLEAGSNPDTSGNLLRASQALENYIKDSTDPAEIKMARTIIMLLTRLINADQQRMTEGLGLEDPAPATPTAQGAEGGGMDMSRIAQMLGQSQG